MNWQTPLALTIVALTLAILIFKKLRKKSSSCGGSCCDTSAKSKAPAALPPHIANPSQPSKNKKTASN